MERRDLGQAWRAWIRDRLPSYLNRDPRAVGALTLTPPSGRPALAQVADRILTLPETGRFDLTQYTLATLATTLQGLGWGATVLDGIPATLGATALIDTGASLWSPQAVQDLTVQPTLAVATSAVWQVLRPLAAMADRHHADVVGLLLGVLEGPWLDLVGQYLGLPRYGGEPDPLYQQRVYSLALTGTPNGVGIAALFAALGYALTWSPTGPAQVTATIQWPTYQPSGFVYTEPQIADMIDALTAVGVLVTVVFSAALTDTLTLGDTLTSLSQVSAACAWGGTLPDGTGWQQGFVYNQSTWN